MVALLAPLDYAGRVELFLRSSLFMILYVYVWVCICCSHNSHHIFTMESEDQDCAASDAANNQKTAKEVINTFLDETTVHGLPQLHNKHGEYLGVGGGEVICNNLFL